MHRPISRVIALAALASLLTACGGAVSSCPPLVEYDQAFRDRLADELGKLPWESATVQAISDYAVLRDQVRACR